MTRSPTASVRAARSSAAGENGSSKNDWEAWKTFPAPADPGFFPPELVVRVKAIACEFPAHVGEPLSRWSVAELGSHVRACGLTASLSDTTIWRWLNEDAIRPWQHRCWIFPRDPDFETKAGRILDLYQRLWKGRYGRVRSLGRRENQYSGALPKGGLFTCTTRSADESRA